MIISVGYRVKSKNGILFRKWANKIIKDYLIKGYAINNKRLEYLEKTINLIDIANRVDDNLKGNEAREIIRVISNYSKALNLLDNYDHKKIDKPSGNITDKKITYEECKEIINNMKFESDLFGKERDGSFNSSINVIYQTSFGEELYKTREEKAANLLYFITKNHSFYDGNKRIAASIFLYFLYKNNMLYKNSEKVISDSALAATTILIACSRPEEKEMIVNLIMNFLV